MPCDMGSLFSRIQGAPNSRQALLLCSLDVRKCEHPDAVHNVLVRHSGYVIVEKALARARQFARSTCSLA